MAERRRKTYIDDPEYLRRWFLEKGHPFLVFRIADLMDMVASDQRLFLKVLQRVAPAEMRVGPPPSRDDDLRGYLQRNIGFRGYTKMSVATLIRVIEFEDLRRFQGFCSIYRAVRENKFEPSRVEDCDCLKKDGPKGCRQCEGTGRLTVLLEVGDIEQALAEGHSWEDIEENIEETR